MDNVGVLRYIHGYTAQNGYPPSMREIGHHFNIHNITVSGICTGLKQLGYLSNTHKKARSLVLTEKGLDAIEHSIPEIVIINDKAYVRLSEYQELQNRLSKRICELQADLSKVKTQNERLSYAPSLLRDICACRKDPCLDELIDEAECYLTDLEKEGGQNNRG